MLRGVIDRALDTLDGDLLRFWMLCCNLTRSRRWALRSNPAIHFPPEAFICSVRTLRGLCREKNIKTLTGRPMTDEGVRWMLHSLERLGFLIQVPGTGGYRRYTIKIMTGVGAYDPELDAMLGVDHPNKDHGVIQHPNKDQRVILPGIAGRHPPDLRACPVEIMGSRP